MSKTENEKKRIKEAMRQDIKSFALEFADVAVKWGVKVSDSRTFTFSTGDEITKTAELDKAISVVVDYMGKRISIQDSDTPLAIDDLNPYSQLKYNITNMDQSDLAYLQGRWQVLWEETITIEDALVALAAINTFGEHFNLINEDSRVFKSRRDL